MRTYIRTNIYIPIKCIHIFTCRLESQKVPISVMDYTSYVLKTQLSGSGVIGFPILFVLNLHVS